MDFQAIVISPVQRPEQHIVHREIWSYRQELKKVFARYGAVSCPYMMLQSESSYKQYQGNFAVVEFKNKRQASRAMRAIERGEVNYNGLKLTVRPLETSFCPIDKLSNGCLSRIFRLLPLVEQLKLSYVCRRWKSVSRSLFETTTAIDLRELKWFRACHKKYVLDVRDRLRDIYCYDDDGLSVLRHCPHLENLALEFRSYRQLGPKGKLVRTSICLEPKLLLGLGNLTRLMLKLRDDRYTFFSLLQHLPATMTEIHLLNDVKQRRDIEKYGRKFVDLSKFVMLRALTLKDYDFNEVSLIGLESLKSLVYLRLDGSQLKETQTNQLQVLRNLEHLSLQNLQFSYPVIAIILKRNPNLTFLHPPDITIVNHDYDYHLWPDILDLRNLRVFHMSGFRYNLHYEGVSPSVEYVELGGSWSYSPYEFLRFFPNVKILKLNCYREELQMQNIVQMRQTIVNRDNKTPFKLVTGRVTKMVRDLRNFKIENFEHCEFLNEREIKIMRSGDWSGWATEGGPPPTSNPSEVVLPQPPSADSPGVEMLTDDCLLRIFSLFSLDEKVSLARVCRRWRAVVSRSWASHRSFDVQTLTSHENARRYIIEAGRHLRDVYHFGACGLSGIRAHCRRVESLALDYRFRTCRCYSSVSYGERRSVLELKSTLVELKHLTRLMLRDVDVLTTDIFEYLPAGIEELHVFNKTVLSDASYGQDNPEESAVDNLIDLSGYVKLRALTLVDTQVSYTYATGQPPGAPQIAGLDKLENLLYLRLGGSVALENPARSLSNLFKLEYLAVQLRDPIDSLTTLIENNRELQYLDIAEAFDVVSDRLLIAVTSLEKLRFLRLSKRYRLWENEVESAEFHFLREMSSLEFLDCEGDCLLPAELKLQLVASAPKLRMANFTVEKEWFALELLRVAESNLLTRDEEDSVLKIFLGIRGVKICENLELRPPHVILDDAPAYEYHKSLDGDFWGGWYTSRGISRISEIFEDMLSNIYR